MFISRRSCDQEQANGSLKVQSDGPGAWKSTLTTLFWPLAPDFASGCRSIHIRLLNETLFKWIE